MLFSAKFYLYLTAVLIPAIILLEFAVEHRKRKFLKDMFSRDITKKLFVNYDPRILELKKVLRITGFLLILFALAGPRFGMRFVNIKRRGVDIILAIDVSKSMLAPDIKPTRIEKAKGELARLVNMLSGNRIGIIAFAGKPFLQCPITLDTGAVRLFLDSINTDMIPIPGTAIGEAIQLAAKSFLSGEKQYKALILLTDGEDHESNPTDYISLAKREGIRIYTIGFGTVRGDLIPEKDGSGSVVSYKKDKKGETIMTRLNEDALRELALKTGGEYYGASDGGIEVNRIAESVSEMENKQLSSGKYDMYEEKYYYFLLAALVLVLTEMFLPDKMPGRLKI